MDWKKIIFLIIIIIIIYVLITMINKKNSTSSINNAQNEVTLTATSVDPTQSNAVNYAASIWFYVNNWDYNYGKMKVLVSRGLTFSSSTTCPSGCNLSTGCCIGGATPVDGTCPTGSLITSCSEYILTSFTNSLANSNNLPPCPLILLGDTINNLYIIQSVVKSTSTNVVNSLTSFIIPTPSTYEFDLAVVMVENFPIQKWVNLIISFYGTTLDIYLDGKLARTVVLPNIVYANNISSSNVVLTPNGGFDGLTSKFQYFANALNPTQAWDIYTKGYSNNMFNLGQYKLKFSIMDGQTAENSFEI